MESNHAVGMTVPGTATVGINAVGNHAVGDYAGSGFAVQLHGISKTHPGSAKKANSNISLAIRRGEILCIAGENGAGKTTLMKILGGLEQPDEGSIFVNGSAVAIDSPHIAQKLGLGMVHQHFMLFPDYTVAENIVIGMEPRKWGFFFDGAKAKKEASRIIETHGFSIDPERQVKTLTVGEMQQVEICRLLYRNVDIIILDEPSAVLTEQEVLSFFATLRVLASEGKSLFLITHKLREIKLISDRVAVLRQGELVGICNTKNTDEYEISKMMLGSSDASVYIENAVKRTGKKAAAGKPVIVFDNVTVMRRGQKQPLLNKLSFSVSPGEIVGFAGVGGNGLGVLEALLGGFLHPSSGKIMRNGIDTSSFNIHSLRRLGLAYVPADRLSVGSAVSATIDENTIICRRRKFAKAGFLKSKAVKDFSASLVSRYSIAGAEKPPTVGASTLSGGNLQKLILARETDCLQNYIVFCEPTWGLDISAGAFVWNEISQLREKGIAVILISTNLDEILALADRICVMYRGSIAAEFENDYTQAASLKEKIGNSMQGLK
jgi:simple sugar transport system ATP-binding protein